MKHKITHAVVKNYLLKRLNTQLLKQKQKSSIKVPKAAKPTNKKTLGTCVVYSHCLSLSKKILQIDTQVYSICALI